MTDTEVPAHKLANDMMMIVMYGMSKEEAIERSICLNCKKHAPDRCFSDSGKNDYLIHGVCEQCVAKLFDQKVPTGMVEKVKEGDSNGEVQTVDPQTQ